MTLLPTHLVLTYLAAAHGLIAFDILSRTLAGSLMSAIWQGLALAILASVVLRMMPKVPAAVRFTLWFSVFSIVVMLPVAAILSHHGTPAAALPTPAAWLTLDSQWSSALISVWLAASLFRIAGLVIAACRVRSLWREARPIPPDLLQDIDTDSNLAQLCVSEEVDRPTVIGFFAPKIVLPQWLLDKLTPSELRQIVLHEASHLRRADDWMNLFQKIALALFPLNPALFWVERRLCFERELACDDRVLRATGAPKAYATCLATIAEYRLASRGLALALGALGRESELGRRIGRILRRSECMHPLQARLVMVAAICTLCAGTVALSRCPQIIAFGVAAHPAQTMAATSPQPLAPDAPALQSAYRQVVFHPSYAPAGLPKHAVSAFSTGTRRNLKYTLPATTNERWLVVTTWQRIDGVRMTLTTERQAARTNRVVFVPASAPATEDLSPRVHPYAAVALNDGWLVFQL